MSSAPRPVLLKFTPSAQTPAILERLTVQREDLIASLLDDVFGPTGSQSHRLLVGSRGLGKSHVIAVLNNRAASDPRADTVRIAMLDEDHWRRRTYEKFLVDVVRALKLPTENATGTTEDRLRSAAESHRIVILVENLDELFRKIGADGQRRFRALLESSRQILVIATTPRLFTGVQSHSAPFYGFFQTTFLDELTLDSALDLLRAVAEITHDDALATFLETDLARRRLKVVETLAGGHPRIWMLLAGCISVEWIDDLVPLFLETVDELTAYYQSRLAELGDQSQELVALVAEAPGAISGRDLAKQADLSPNRVATAMADLEQRGYVRRATIEGLPSKGDRRLVYWELREPLMRLCLEIKTSQGRPLRLIVRFLRAWFEQELPAQLDRLPSTAVLARSYVEAALEPEDEFEEIARRAALELEATAPGGRSRAADLADAGFRLLTEDDYESAAAHFTQALELEENSAKGLLGLAVVRMRSGDWDAVEDLASRAITLAPESGELHCMLGLAHLQLGRPELAVEELQKATELEPDYAPYHHSLAGAYTRASRAADAIASFRRAATLDPSNPVGALGLARALHESDAPLDEALAAYARASELNPDRPAVTAAYSTLLLRKRRPQLAAEVIDKALLSGASGNVWLLALRAQAAVGMGDYEEAATALEVAEQIAPNDTLLLFVRATLFQLTGKLEDMAATADRLRALEPDFAGTHLLDAVVQDRLGRHALAADAAERLTALEPNESWAWARLAENLWRAGRIEEVPAAASRAVDLDPDLLTIRLLAAAAKGSPADRELVERLTRNKGEGSTARPGRLWRDVWRVRPSAIPILIDAYTRAGAADEAAQILTSMIPVLVSNPSEIDALQDALSTDDYEIVGRLIRAAAAWTNDHDSRHLLDLPREEREILTRLLIEAPEGDE